MTTRVAIVDDDALVRAGLRMILGGDSSLSVVGEASDGREALDMIARASPHVVLMDIRMPLLDGLEATKALTRRGDQVRIIVLTTFDTDELVVTALRYGAVGFLLKDTSPGNIVDAVRRVAAGESILSPSVTAQLIAKVTGGSHAERERAVVLLEGLTDREREVAIAVGRGLSNTEISVQLFMGVATVKTHIGHVFVKLDATNRVQVARVVHDAQLASE
ncbi:response regulator transcription factor [Cryobacterium roopkundense]|uniref:DNA-binding NarL/FixJ family response regulator n=1 Tax=Cryobacterium roopkundense TaxID=1001240 RepID=A0A7W8ZV11_9MICO|nr:response regulator transcription factor [Cryobacterium roopkundense]MBB5640530.1 DNA-binding NarL/FixJ family response regulator [Cryobacterium roopkundense]